MNFSRTCRMASRHVVTRSFGNNFELVKLTQTVNIRQQRHFVLLACKGRYSPTPGEYKAINRQGETRHRKRRGNGFRLSCAVIKCQRTESWRTGEDGQREEAIKLEGSREGDNGRGRD